MWVTNQHVYLPLVQALFHIVEPMLDNIYQVLPCSQTFLLTKTLARLTVMM